MKITKLLKSMTKIALATTLALSIVGCGSSATSSKATNSKTAGKFTVAYLPNESTEQNADARKGMAKDLSAAIGMEVVELQASDYNAVIEAMRTGKVEMAFFGPLSFSLANERAKAEPIGMKAKDGDKSKATYKAVLIARSDSNLNSISDIKGKTMAFVDPNSTSGNIIPSASIMKEFASEKLTMDDLHTNGKFFSSVMFSGKHQAGLQAVIKGDVDVAPISDEILKAEIANGNAKEGAVKIIYSSDPIPAEPMAIRGDLPVELKDKVKKFILSYDNEEYFEKVVGTKGSRFVPTSIEDYKSIVELNKQLNK